MRYGMSERNACRLLGQSRGTQRYEPMRRADEYKRECLALRVARRLNSQDVIETLSEVMLWRGIPEHIRSDNGPEFVARQLREECLNGEIFYSLKEARIVIEQWRQQYNRVPRPQMIM